MLSAYCYGNPPVASGPGCRLQEQAVSKLSCQQLDILLLVHGYSNPLSLSLSCVVWLEVHMLNHIQFVLCQNHLENVF